MSNMFITNEALIHRGLTPTHSLLTTRTTHLAVTRGILDVGEMPDVLPELGHILYRPLLQLVVSSWNDNRKREVLHYN